MWEQSYGEKAGEARTSLWEIWMGLFMSTLQVLPSASDRMKDLSLLAERKEADGVGMKKGSREMKGEKG